MFNLMLVACASQKLLHLESQVVEQQNADLRTDLLACQNTATPDDYILEVTPDTVRDFLVRAGFPQAQQAPNGAWTVPIQGEHTQFVLNVQLFSKEKVLYISAANYLRMEQAASSSAMVLLLTQLAAINYELLLGKFQLNPNTGEISLSMEINLDDGLGYNTFERVAHHLVNTADARYPDLLRAAQGKGL